MGGRCSSGDGPKDRIGARQRQLAVAPVLLVIASGARFPREPDRIAEAAALLVALVGLSLLVFAEDIPANSDESAALTGLKAAGTRSGGVARLQGTSEAAPQVARRLVNG